MKPSAVTLARAASRLLAEAAEWRLLGLMFACPQGEWRNQVAALAAEVSDDLLREAARLAMQEADEGDYHTAFGPGGPAAPREISHRQTTLTSQYLAELLACYHAFAYCAPRNEPPDHIATELDFIAYLRLKQAFALSRQDETSASIAAEAAQHFMNDHVATILPGLMPALESSGIQYLRSAAAGLSARVGPRHAKASCSSPGLEHDEQRHSELPIYEEGNCCSDFTG